jgi:O-antigen/teichoic acid export membrane protein
MLVPFLTALLKPANAVSHHGRPRSSQNLPDQRSSAEVIGPSFTITVTGPPYDASKCAGEIAARGVASRSRLLHRWQAYGPGAYCLSRTERCQPFKDFVTAVKTDDLSPTSPAPSDWTAVPSQWRGRIATSFWSLADQGVVSFGNFATVLLLGRKLTPAALGIYGVILGVLLFLNNLQSSLITYPLSVHGATSDLSRLRQLTWMSMALTALLLIPMAFGIAWAAGAMKMLALAPWIIAALVLWQFQETLRRALMSQLRYRDALWGDALSYLGQAAVIAALIWRRQTGLPWIFAAMALTSALGAAVQWFQIKPAASSLTDLVRRARDCWDLGRWTALSNLAGIVNIQLVMWILVATHGAAEGGKLLALGTILGLTHPALFSIGNLIIPASARALRSGGLSAARKIALTYGAIGGAMVIPYYILLIARPAMALHVFYGAGSPYVVLLTALRFFAVAYIGSYICTVQSSLLNGMARSRSALLIQLATVVVTAAVTLPLAAYGGVAWSLGGACASTLAGLIVGSILLHRSKQDSPGKSFVMDDATALPAAA